MKLIKTILLLAALSVTSIANAYEVDFSKDTAKVLFGDNQKTSPKVENGQIKLPGELSTQTIPVQGLKKYKLEIDAQVHSDFVIEKNDRAHILTLKSFRNRATSSYTISFQNAEGKDISSYGQGIKHRVGTRGFFLSNKKYTYTQVFYTPEEARSIKVNFESSNSKDTRILALRLHEETAEGTLNTNPNLSYGELNYSGWQPGREGRLYVLPDGKSYLDSGYRGTTTVFPIEDGKDYVIYAKGKGGRLEINYYNDKGEKIKSTALIYPEAEGVTKEFSTPKNTSMAYLTLASTILEEVRITEVK